MYKTFAEAKQPLPPQIMDEFNNKNGSGTILNVSSGNYFDTVTSSDPTNYIQPSKKEYEEQQINQNYDETSAIVGASGISNPYYDEYNNSSNESMKAAGVRSIPQSIRNAENFVNSDPSSEYYYQQQASLHDSNRRRRKSRELPIPPEAVVIHGPTDEESTRTHRKPETMRSISEDTAVNKNSKVLPRRSMSHPEKEKTADGGGTGTEVTRKVPTPKPLSEILERQKKAASIRRKIQCKSTDQMDNSSSLSSSKYADCVYRLFCTLILFPPFFFLFTSSQITSSTQSNTRKTRLFKKF